MSNCWFLILIHLIKQSVPEVSWIPEISLNFKLINTSVNLISAEDISRVCNYIYFGSKFNVSRFITAAKLSLKWVSIPCINFSWIIWAIRIRYCRSQISVCRKGAYAVNIYTWCQITDWSWNIKWQHVCRRVYLCVCVYMCVYVCILCMFVCMYVCTRVCAWVKEWMNGVP